MTEWSRAFKELGLKKLSERFFEGEETKLAGLIALEEFRLPHLKRITSNLKGFVANPSKVFNKLESKKYFVNLISDKWQSRMRTIDLTTEQVVKYVNENVPDDRFVDFKVTVGEYFKNLFGGNIVINKDGSLLLELARGAHGNLATGLSTPLVKAWVRKSGQKIDYSGPDKLRGVVELAITMVPKTELGFLPSYYEFIVVGKKGLMPIFIDYRSGSIYQINQRMTGLVACKGKVRGKVKIIKPGDAVADFPGGCILVSKITSPDLLPAIVKCVGMITEKGGITSHAAIVAREFGIPCIVGMYNATRILKNGVEIELDANNGVVMIQ